MLSYFVGDGLSSCTRKSTWWQSLDLQLTTLKPSVVLRNANSVNSEE